MEKCLVTKFSTSVNDDELKKVGEARIRVKMVSNHSSQTQGFSFYFTKDTEISIIGDGYFTDESLLSNLGKHINAKKNTTTVIYVSNNDLEISISDKYSLYSFLCYPTKMLSSLNEGIGKVLDTREFLYCNKLAELNVSDTASIGNYSDFKNLKALKSLYTLNSKITGRLDDLKDNLNLTTLYCSNISGSINVLDNINLNIIYFKDADIYGDIATLPKTSTLFRGDYKSFDWSDRNKEANIISLIALKLDNVDKMLQNQAQCVIPLNQTNKQISVIGTRTSASDDAVTTLQQKGYTVTITPA